MRTKAAAAVARYFGIDRHNTTIRREARAGFTSFLTMAYILFVNPDILSKAISVPNASAQLLSTTALAAAVGTLLMGLVARYPFATAPGMGLNAYFTYALVLGQGLSWQVAFGAVFLSGVLAVVISAAGVREFILKAFPLTIKRATAAGIGLFLAMIGFTNAGLVVDSAATLVTLGDLTAPTPLLALAGLVITGVLLHSWQGSALGRRNGCRGANQRLGV